MRKLSLKLYLLNLYRAIIENLLAWGILAAAYSLIAVMIVQTLVLVTGQEKELGFPGIWLLVVFLALFPGLLMTVPSPLGLPIYSPGKCETWMQLYWLHRLRRPQTYLVFIASLIAILSLPQGWSYYSVLLVQIPVSAEIFWVSAWRELARTHKPRIGASHLVLTFTNSLLAQTLLMLLALVVMGKLPLNLAFSCLAAVLASSVVVMEGDSGRPFLVNLISLGSGTLWAALVMWSPWWFLALLYFSYQVIGLSVRRLHSVERMDQDVVIP